IRLMDGSLFVHSPVQLSDATRAKVDEHGVVKHIVSPNKLHHLYMGDWADAYPAAKLYASPGLGKKRGDLRFEATLGDTPEPPWDGEIDQCVFRGSVFMEEVVLQTIMGWKAERVLLIHGPCVTVGAQAFLENGFAWLAP
ncbi:MAG: DUF4336 domain-containing protein, partial [Polyangiaceae bacterium]